MRESVYTPDPSMLRPGVLMREMYGDLMASRELAWRLFIRNISAMYRQTLFGYLWAFLPPVFTAAIFVLMQSQKVIEVRSDGMAYPVFAIIGVMIWQVFVDAVNSPLKLVSQSKAMLAKINFPREALILAGFYEVVFNFLIRLIIIVGVMVYFQVNPSVSLLLAPVFVGILIGIGIMVGLLLSPLSILYQDFEKGIPMLIPVWMMVSGAVVPLPQEGILSVFRWVNPVSPVLGSCREVIVGAPITEGTLVLGVCAVTFFLLLLGWLMFRLSMPHIIARIPA